MELIFSLFLAIQPSHAAKVIGHFAVVEGDVFIEKRGKKRKARVGRTFSAKTFVETAAGSRAVVVFTDENILAIDENSRISFAKYNQKIAGRSHTFLQLMYGRARSQLKRKYNEEDSNYRIQTDVAVAGVRGTDFVVESSSEQTEFIVVSGQIDVGKLGPRDSILFGRSVGPGMGLSVLPASLPGDVYAVSEEKLSEVSGWSGDLDSAGPAPAEGDMDDELLEDTDEVLKDIGSFSLDRPGQFRPPVEFRGGEVLPESCATCERVIESRNSEVVINPDIE